MVKINGLPTFLGLQYSCSCSPGAMACTVHVPLLLTGKLRYLNYMATPIVQFVAELQREGYLFIILNVLKIVHRHCSGPSPN